MTVNIGDILAWKNWQISERDSFNIDLDELFLVVDIDSDEREPYLLLSLSGSGYERFSGKGFSDKRYWEMVV